MLERTLHLYETELPLVRDTAHEVVDGLSRALVEAAAGLPTGDRREQQESQAWRREVSEGIQAILARMDRLERRLEGCMAPGGGASTQRTEQPGSKGPPLLVCPLHGCPALASLQQQLLWPGGSRAWWSQRTRGRARQGARGLLRERDRSSDSARPASPTHHEGRVGCLPVTSGHAAACRTHIRGPTVELAGGRGYMWVPQGGRQGG